MVRRLRFIGVPVSAVPSQAHDIAPIPEATAAAAGGVKQLRSTYGARLLVWSLLLGCALLCAAPAEAWLAG